MVHVVAGLIFPLTCTGFTIGFVMMCGDEEDNNVMGRVKRGLVHGVYPRLMRLLYAVPGGRRLGRACHETGVYLFHKPNPVLMYLYLVMILGGFGVFVVFGYVHIPNKRVSEVHLMGPFLALNALLFCFSKACGTAPGVIHPYNVESLLESYPYDGFLYVERVCETCRIPRVPRSKHDRMTNKCVEKFDHFCPWINNAVGARNYGWFLGFLSTTSFFLFYGTYLLLMILLHIADAERLWDAVFIHHGTGEKISGSPMVIVQYMLANHGPMMFIWLLCAVMGAAVFLFLLYHLYLIWCGTTTNESSKWANVADFYATTLPARRKGLKDDGTPLKDPVLLPELSESEQARADELLMSVKMPALEDRNWTDFPSKPPKNMYDRGSFLENFRAVFNPPKVTRSEEPYVGKVQKAEAQAPSLAAETGAPAASKSTQTKEKEEEAMLEELIAEAARDEAVQKRPSKKGKKRG